MKNRNRLLITLLTLLLILSGLLNLTYYERIKDMKNRAGNDYHLKIREALFHVNQNNYFIADDQRRENTNDTMFAIYLSKTYSLSLDLYRINGTLGEFYYFFASSMQNVKEQNALDEYDKLLSQSEFIMTVLSELGDIVGKDYANWYEELTDHHSESNQYLKDRFQVYSEKFIN